jgi:ketosteroid isomerase-like protein
MLSLNQKRSAALNDDCHVSGFFIPHIAGLGSEASAQESSKKNLQPLWTSRIKPLQGRRKAGHREVIAHMSTVSNTQRLTTAYVHQIFRNLESGDGKGFFEHVADDVDWIVEGTHPLAGHYHTKADFLAHTFDKLAKVLPQGTQLHVQHLLIGDDWAVVELHSEATAKNGLRFDNRYCWVCRFADGRIVEVRAYLDSALVARLFAENPI